MLTDIKWTRGDLIHFGGMKVKKVLGSLGRTTLLHTLGSRPIRRLLTSGFDSGMVAIGECNYYMFPARFVTIDWRDADFSVRLDTAVDLPFADDSQNIVYAAHVFEHLGDGVEPLLQEIRRILRPGGAIRIEVPDLDTLVDAYRANDRSILDHFQAHRAKKLVPALGDQYLEDHLTVLGEVVSYNRRADHLFHIPAYVSVSEFNEAMAQGPDAITRLGLSKLTEEQRLSGGHNRAFTFALLEKALKDAGFSNVARVTRSKTEIDDLSLSNGPGRIWRSIAEKKRREFYSLYVEAWA